MYNQAGPVYVRGFPMNERSNPIEPALLFVFRLFAGLRIAYSAVDDGDVGPLYDEVYKMAASVAAGP